MPVTRSEIDVAQEVIDVLVGDWAEAEAYARDPEGWLDGHGYADVSAEALATSAEVHPQTAAPPVSAGAVAQLDYIVYNHYDTDDSITDSVAGHGSAFSDLLVSSSETTPAPRDAGTADDVHKDQIDVLSATGSGGAAPQGQNVQDDTLASLESLDVSEVTILGGTQAIADDDEDGGIDEGPQGGTGGSPPGDAGDG